MRFVRAFFSVVLTIALLFAVALGAYYFHIVREINDVASDGLESGDVFTPESENVIPLTTFYYDRLGDTERTAYVRLLNGYRYDNDGTEVPRLTADEFSNVIEALRNDNPDRPAFGAKWYLTHYRLCDTITRGSDVADKIALELPLSNAVAQILAGMPDAGDYEKELYFHDYIINHCAYETTGNSNNAYGALVENLAVCTGYARAMQLLLNKAGIYCTVVSGDAMDDEGDWEAHMWNYVRIADEYYFTDVTWDDPRTDSWANTLCHRYLNLNSPDLNIDHKNYDTAAFSTAAEEYNYFVRNNAVFDFYNGGTIDAIAELFITDAVNGETVAEFRFSNDTAFYDAQAGLFGDEGYDLRGLLDAAGYGSVRSIYHMSSEEHRYIRIKIGE